MASSDGGGGKGNQNWGKNRRTHQEFELGFSFSGSNSYQSFTQKMKNVSLNLKRNETELDRSDSADADADADAGVLPLRPHAEDCSYYMRTGSCRFGSKCKYNHPLNRPILKADDEEAGTETGSDENSDKSSVVCKFYLMPGGCKNGESCKYLHSKPETTMATPELRTPELNFMGLPMREGEKECPFFMRNGSCAYGTNCRYHHPDPTPDEVSNSFSSTLNAEAEGYYGSTAGNVGQEPFSQLLSGHTCIIPNYGGFYMDNPISYMPVASLYSEEFHQTTEWSVYQVPEYPQEKQPPRSISKIKTKMDKRDLSFKKVEESSEDAGEPKSPVALPPPRPKREPVELNELGLPLRPGKEICWHHENYGLCRKGRICTFDHPMDKRSKNLPDMSKSGTKEVTPDEDEVYNWN